MSTMTTQLEQALGLLFPEGGRQALDVKFFFDATATVEGLSEQIAVCFQTMNDDQYSIVDVDA
ncbi:MAG: hypothetical protein ACTIDN_06530 [Acetobacter sp.]|uniref:hypothetical protein n=1 Tax=Acetobacter sp. TaxID=440 RepID=UPI003F923623